MTGSGVAALAELRVLDGPNLFFARPAVQLTLDVPWYLESPAERLAAFAVRVGLPGASVHGRLRPGPANSDHRGRFAARLAAHLTRRLAEAARTNLGVRARHGPEPGQIVVAFPWRRRNLAEEFGGEVAALLAGAPRSRRTVRALLTAAAARLSGVEPGDPPAVPEPSIPVIAVTGTNGKTTTVRLLAHIARTAGLHVAYSSTDGVYFDDALVEEGDYSGFAGAGCALSQPGAQLAVLETARGGILLRGVGTSHNDVALVTNVSADHLGLRGIRTMDQLAEVKSTILKITRPGGWDVLNADDPRVLAMRRVARGRPWLCSLDPNHPALRAAMEEHGRGMSVIDGCIAVLTPGRDARPLVSLEEIPMTIAGLSTHNIQNAMGAAAAALGAGLDEPDVVRGLTTFVLDPDRNPGRTNLFELEGRVVVVDYAHNEAAMRGLVEVCRGLCRPGGAVWLAFGSAGDRTDEILHGLAYLAARGADHVAIAELTRYLRGRDRDDLHRRLVAGARDGGADDVPVHPDEVHALARMLDVSAPGDVLAVTALAQRPEVFALLEERGATRPSPGRVRRLVRRPGGTGPRAPAPTARRRDG